MPMADLTKRQQGFLVICVWERQWRNVSDWVSPSQYQKVSSMKTEREGSVARHEVINIIELKIKAYDHLILSGLFHSFLKKKATPK